jgi:hypothetical protein
MGWGEVFSWRHLGGVCGRGSLLVAKELLDIPGQDAIASAHLIGFELAISNQTLDRAPRGMQNVGCLLTGIYPTDWGDDCSFRVFAHEDPLSRQ